MFKQYHVSKLLLTLVRLFLSAIIIPAFHFQSHEADYFFYTATVQLSHTCASQRGFIFAVFYHAMPCIYFQHTDYQSRPNYELPEVEPFCNSLIALLQVNFLQSSLQMLKPQKVLLIQKTTGTNRTFVVPR